ncbi:Subtilisin-like protease [Quillaja saponaria]|uniref:Subtilisin-like protease n=1 Tax=Quillaja saponaria TaxID=32244 RepID=A0AAD7LCH6_QUISA|nr:Subtilisin-like protease [Quillaja saponaria]
MSVGGSPTEFFEDAISLGAFRAVQNGISVVLSAGNEGPTPYSVSNFAPWMLTVGPSTIDREFTGYVELGYKKNLKGASLAVTAFPSLKSYPLIKAADANAINVSCADTVEKGQVAALAGAVGMILANDEQSGDEIIADPHVLPATHISFIDAQYVYAYINSTIRAPGVSIIAAYSEDNSMLPYVLDSGTSMSCPHVAGIVGLLKRIHPDWSPGAMRSSIMTTARTRDVSKKPILDSSNANASTPFAYGAGHVHPDGAMDPGLVYDLNTTDYLNFLCSRGYNQTTINRFNENHPCPQSYNLTDFNYPSITVPDLDENTVVTRTVTNVGPPGTYRVRVKAPAGVLVLVEPSLLTFGQVGEKKTYKVFLKPKFHDRPMDYTFGHLTWSDGIHIVRSPIVAKHKIGS